MLRTLNGLKNELWTAEECGREGRTWNGGGSKAVRLRRSWLAAVLTVGIFVLGGLGGPLRGAEPDPVTDTDITRAVETPGRARLQTG